MPLTQVQNGMLAGVIPASLGGTGTTAGVTGFKNRIINGAQVIAQRGTSFTPSALSDTYTLDRWEAAMNSGSAAYSIAQSSVVPNGNFTNSALLTVTSAAAPAGASYVFYQTKIEGYNMADLGWGTANAQTVTVSFWIRSSVTGTYSFHLINGSISLSYIATFSISAANTWQYVTLTVPGPTTGTWNTTNGVGIYAGVDLGMGSSRQTTANTWSSGASFFCGTSSNVQWINNAGATMYVTAFQFEVGSAATNFDVRSYGTELALCQRYFIQTAQYGQSTGGSPTMTSYIGFNTTAFNWFWHSVSFPTTMRTSATVTTSDFNGNTGKISIWTSTGGGSSFNITPYTVYATRDGFSYSDYNNAKYGIGIGGYIASAEL